MCRKANMCHNANVCHEANRRFARLVTLPVISPQAVEASELPDTERGEGGFGSTGKK